MWRQEKSWRHITGRASGRSGTGADEVSREVRVDDGLGAGACGWRGAVDAAQDHGPVGVAAELVLGRGRVASRAARARCVDALRRVELLGDELADRVREDGVRALEHWVDALVLLGRAVRARPTIR